MGNMLEENKQQYIREYYLPHRSTLPGIEKYTDICGWTDYYLNSNVLFSRRRVFYDPTTFPDKLHKHGFYEIIIFLGGTVSYVSGSEIFTPHYGDIMVFPPDCEHTVRSSKTGIYDRAVLYVEADWFQSAAGGYIPEVFSKKDAVCYTIHAEHAGKFMDLLTGLEQCLTAETSDAMMLSSGYLSMLLTMLSRYAIPNYSRVFQIPQKLMEIKAYIDANFQAIASVDALSTQFYYSREHISRLFREYYKISPSSYLRSKKVEHARQFLDLNCSVRYAFDVSGFQSYSAFVKAFEEFTGTTPGKYRIAPNKPRSRVGKDL